MPRKKAAAVAADAAPNGTNGTHDAANGIDTTGFIPDATPYGVVRKPLQDLRFTISGPVNVMDYMPYGIEYLISTLGASQTHRVSADVTHVLATREDWLKGSTKVKAAIDKGLPVLRGMWAIECDRTQTMVDVEKHTWPNVIAEEEKLRAAREEFLEAQKAAETNGTANGTAGDATNGTDSTADKKRPIAVANPNGAADGDDQEEEEKPKTKRARATKAKKAAPVKDEDEEMQDADDEAAKQLQDEDEKDMKADGAQVAKKGLVIPVDNSLFIPQFEVYVDPDSGVIYDASLNQTNASNNNNKFYIVQMDSFITWTRWGRVGEPGANATLGGGSFADALSQFEKKFKDKSGLRWEDRTKNPKPGKYAFVERSYEPDSEDEDGDAEAKNAGTSKEVKEEEPEPECTLDDPTKSLMEMIFNNNFMQATLAELNYDANKLPLGKLSKATILRGFEQLKNLSDLFDDNALAADRWGMGVSAATEHFSNTYYSLIPHDFGRNRPPIISDERRLKREVELLESLSDMKIAADLMKTDKKAAAEADPVHHLDRKFQGLDLEEMTPLKRTTKEFKTLEKYLCGTIGSTHSYSYEVVDIFRIERRGEKERFAKSDFADIASDKRLLWHGSRCTNFGGILSQGLRIAPPEAPVSGYMFGKGIYLADMSSKSAGYCVPYMSNNEGLLLLCEAELGDPMLELVHSSYTADDEAKKAGSWSTKGQGTFAPPKWMDAGAVHKSLKGVQMPDPSKPAQDTKVPNASLYYNEYICYDVDQVQLRYLFRVKM
ncbi:hypothetical protein PWT90_07718 [Aphanocladium album]|nr:hypothetical protein PWT90_07718 [Aphanocladium album]